MRTSLFDRDGSIAAVMESEVLAKHRKALMLFGIAHLLHGGGPGQGDAVTRYERHYPGRTFVISDLGYYGSGSEPFSGFEAPGGVWPSLLKTSSSRLGALPLLTFYQPPFTTDESCNVLEAFPGASSQPVSHQIDGFLYLGPPGALLSEPLPADIALDRAYRAEWLRRMKLVGFPGPASPDELDAQTIAGAADPVLRQAPKSATSGIIAYLKKDCLSRKHPAAAPAK